ncbi:MAG: hypothetical protein WDN25_16020 [Acetobacteraceae bacterium]
MRNDIDVLAFAADCAPVPPADFVAALLRTGFSPEAYRDAYGDLRQQGMGATDALAHYLRVGIHEQRPVSVRPDRRALAALIRLPLADGDLMAQLVMSLLGRPLADAKPPFGAALTERWPLIRDLAREGACPYVIAGDSHSSNYSLMGRRGGRWLVPLHLICHGGSARGLGNPASRSGYGTALREAVRTIRGLPCADDLPFLLQFGQVDIEFVHHFQRVRDGRHSLDLAEYRAFCATTLQRYIGFVTDLFEPSRRDNVHLVSVFPPALTDDAWRHGHLNDDIVRRESEMSREELAAGIRGLEVANLAQRTAIHAAYNEALEAACRLHGFGYVDGFTPLLGADGMLDPRYLIPEGHGFEHHVDSRRTYNVLSRLVWRIGGGGGEHADG